MASRRPSAPVIDPKTAAEQGKLWRSQAQLLSWWTLSIDRTLSSEYPGAGSLFLREIMRKLPFLNGIKAFEAAARNGGFAKAAEELHVSPAAISRMVHLLEQRLGVLLFERKANGLTLTAAGRVYQSGLTQLFDALAN